ALYFLSMVMMLFLPLLNSFAGGFTGLLSFGAPRGPIGLISIGMLSKWFFLGTMVHSGRIWRRMLHPELEKNSFFEGPPLPIFKLLPFGHSYWVTRIFLAPGSVFLAATILGHMYIFQS